MITVEYRQLIIERFDKPSRSDINHHIKNISSKLISQTEISNVNLLLPVKDDVIMLNDSYYQIDRRIIVGKEDKIIYQVSPYQTTRIMSYGSNSWEEDIPLVNEADEYIDKETRENLLEYLKKNGGDPDGEIITYEGKRYYVDYMNGIYKIVKDDRGKEDEQNT